MYSGGKISQSSKFTFFQSDEKDTRVSRGFIGRPPASSLEQLNHIFDASGNLKNQFARKPMPNTRFLANKNHPKSEIRISNQ
jgi:hypothetical protein